MNENKRSITLSILSLLFTFLLSYLALLDNGKNNSEYPFPFNIEFFQGMYQKCCENKVGISTIIFCIIFILHVLCYYWGGSKNKKWLQRLLQHIIDQNLGGEEYETRITIFCKRKGWRFIIQYLFHYLIHYIIFRNLNFNRFCLALRKCPNLFKEYLVIYNRFSFPEQRKSYTFFNAIQEDNITPSSIVEKSYKEGSILDVSTPYISDIDFTKKFINLTTKEKRLIDTYRAKTGMEYDKLCLLNRQANYIYAVPIRYKQKIWGIVVFDNNQQSNNVTIKDKLKNVISDYQKIIQFTIEIYK